MAALSDTQREIQYLDQAATSEQGRGYKRRLLASMELRPGDTVLDVGCGPGTDLGDLALAVGGHGRVIGIDHDSDMVDTARQRVAQSGHAGHESAPIDVELADAHHLPLPEHSVDRARMDRVLQHVADPVAVLTELRRVIRPCGLLALAEPDWDTLIVDDQDIETSRAYTRFLTTVVRNPTIGRQLGRLAVGAGFALRRIRADAIAFSDFAAGDQILCFSSVIRRAVLADAIAEREATAWLERISTGPFFASFTFVTAIVESR